MTQQLPAYLQNYKRGAASTALDSLTKMSMGAQPYISIQGNRFRAIDAVGDEQMIGEIDRKTGIAYADIVIIDANPNVSKVYYETQFDPNASEYMPPTCWSDNGVAPSSQASKPQCRSCAECKLAEWGSDISKLTGKQTKACNDSKKIALFVPELGGMGAFLLRVPPASLKDLANYARTLAANNATVAQVVTRVSFEPNGVGMLNFKAVNWITEGMVASINELDQNKIDLLTGVKDTPRTAALPAPDEQRQLPSTASGSNGTPAPNKPPAGLFGQQEAKPQEQATVVQHEESEVDKLRREMAELQAKLAAQNTAMKPTVEPAKRTRRTKEQIAADEAAKANGGKGNPEKDMFSQGNLDASNAEPEEKMEVPAFLNGGKAGATTAVVARAGGQPADAPSPELQAALDAAFSLNLGGN